MKKYINKKNIIIFICFVLLIVMGTFAFKESQKIQYKRKNPNEIVTKGIKKDETYNGLTFTNTKLVKEAGIYTLTTIVKNTTSKPIDVEEVSIPVKDKEDIVIVSLLGYIGDTLQPNEERQISASTDMDLSNAYTKEIQDKK